MFTFMTCIIFFMLCISKSINALFNFYLYFGLYFLSLIRFRNHFFSYENAFTNIFLLVISFALTFSYTRKCYDRENIEFDTLKHLHVLAPLNTQKKMFS
jgi:hypothetical protein